MQNRSPTPSSITWTRNGFCDPEEEKRTLGQLKAMSDSPDLTTHDEPDIDKINFIKLERSVRISKGKYLRFSKEQIQRMEDAGEIH
jgi:hypothetical protein